MPKYNLFLSISPSAAVHTVKICNIISGHYARTSYGEDLEYKPWDDHFESEFYGKRRVKLLKAIDRIKDQTFFLSQVHLCSIVPQPFFTKCATYLELRILIPCEQSE